MAVKTNEQPIVGAYGDVYTAPVGTAIPTDVDDPGAAWTKLGMISEDGATWTPPEEETEEIKIWQSPYPARTVTTGLSSSLSFALDGWDRVTVPFALGGGEFTEAGSTVIFHPPKAGESDMKALYMKVLDGDVKLGLYFRKGKVTGRDDTSFKPDEAALLNVEFSLQAEAEQDPYNLVFDSATFPANGGGAVAATGATEGTPGNWLPSGATPPATVAALIAGTPNAVAPSPDTDPWTGTTWVACADNAHAYWNGTGWVAGDST